jgi:hypothetical protein
MTRPAPLASARRDRRNTAAITRGAGAGVRTRHRETPRYGHMDTRCLLFLLAAVVLVGPFAGDAGAATPRHAAVASAQTEQTGPPSQPGRRRRVVRSIGEQTYYVALTGNDDAPGSRDAPFRTIQHAADIARAGTTVVVEDGTYAECGNCTGVAYDVLLRHSGTARAPITFAAANLHGAIIDGGGSRRCLGFDDNLAYITLTGFHLRDCAGGIAGLGNAHDIVVKQNIIERIGLTGNCGTNGGYGFAGIGWEEAWNIVVDGNIIHDVGQPHSSYGCSFTNDHGIYGHGHDITIVNNVFYNNNSGWDIQLAGGPSGQRWLIANNTFGARNDPRAPGNIVIWEAQGPNTPSSITIQNNISGPRVVGGFVNCIFGSNTAGLVIRSNIIAAPVDVLIGGCSATMDSNRTGTDSAFVDAAAFDFHLRPSNRGRDQRFGQPPAEIRACVFLGRVARGDFTLALSQNRT